MGRKTFESLGSKALPDRKMIVISSMNANETAKDNDFAGRNDDFGDFGNAPF